ncbi:MAG: chemotaxis protein CheW, partial [bacterium]|nr:chemotaxis protein CheW [bacterium]
KAKQDKVKITETPTGNEIQELVSESEVSTVKKKTSKSPKKQKVSKNLPEPEEVPVSEPEQLKKEPIEEKRAEDEPILPDLKAEKIPEKIKRDSVPVSEEKEAIKEQPVKPKEKKVTEKVPITTFFKIQRAPQVPVSKSAEVSESEEEALQEVPKNEPISVTGTLAEQLSEYEDIESDQIITFFLGSEQYGLDILDAREVKQILPLTPIPRSTGWILGVVNLRGSVFPVVDLKKRINISSDVKYPQNLRRIIIVEIEDTKIGLLVDKINMIFNKQTLEHSLPPALISGGEDFISFIAKKDDNIISIISLTKLFTSEERELLAKIKEDKH